MSHQEKERGGFQIENETRISIQRETDVFFLSYTIAKKGNVRKWKDIWDEGRNVLLAFSDRARVINFVFSSRLFLDVLIQEDFLLTTTIMTAQKQAFLSDKKCPWLLFCFVSFYPPKISAFVKEEEKKRYLQPTTTGLSGTLPLITVREITKTGRERKR